MAAPFHTLAPACLCWHGLLLQSIVTGLHWNCKTLYTTQNKLCGQDGDSWRQQRAGCSGTGQGTCNSLQPTSYILFHIVFLSVAVFWRWKCNLTTKTMQNGSSTAHVCSSQCFLISCSSACHFAGICLIKEAHFYNEKHLLLVILTVIFHIHLFMHVFMEV